ncbi:CLUMA_CG008810, isoform A [Clunio marinus]|uniref:CLUMA_CG008810, isoform A n=1 Tax=Clunio marinus TaxID=568069 RepID=A0A1J1I4F1_9DIPT|nr:CLUMA_CG008810, isoform A [Clunio marinus]
MLLKANGEDEEKDTIWFLSRHHDLLCFTFLGTVSYKVIRHSVGFHLNHIQVKSTSSIQTETVDHTS